MKVVHCLAWMLLLSPATLANPPCVSCAKPVKDVKIIFRDRVKFVDRPIIVRDQVSYLATIIPSNTYNTTITTPPAPQVQQAALTASFNAGAVQYGQFGQAQGGYVQQPIYAPQPGYTTQAQQNQRGLSTEERLDRMDAALAQLCQFVQNGQPMQQRANGSAAPMPSAFENKCAQCHNTQMAGQSGGGFVMYDKGFLRTDFSEREVRKIGSMVRTGHMPPPGNARGIQPATQKEVQEVDRWEAQQP